MACSAAVGGDAGVLPRQDARYGRDPQAASATPLSKVGAGDAGFDFSKIANSGATLAASATLGSAAANWACTKDQVTGLIWEVKTTSGLRSSAHTYTWYSTDATKNGGNAGVLGSNTRGGSLAAAPYNNQCNTQNYVAAVNAAGLCGASDWRLPTRRELLTLVNAGRSSPSIDGVYFPNTASLYYWTATTSAVLPANAWGVFFDFGASFADAKDGLDPDRVRLVR